MKRSDFLSSLQSLLSSPVEGFTDEEKARLLDHVSSSLQAGTWSSSPRLQAIPFVRGRRPFDEIRYAGYGSSEYVGLLMPSSNAVKNRLYLLYRFRSPSNLAPDGSLRLASSIFLYDPRFAEKALPLPHHKLLPLDVKALQKDSSGEIQALPLPREAWNSASLVIALAPEALFRPQRGTALAASLPPAASSPTSLPLATPSPASSPPSASLSSAFFSPAPSWSWEELDPALRLDATDEKDLFTFGHLFHQRIRVDVSLLSGELPLSEISFDAEIYDPERFGTLYRRLLEKLIKPDTRRQAKQAKLPPLDPAYHPWYPVLSIGTEKADLYMGALLQDIVEKKRHFTDPRWLLKVGLYLEFLTCLGIFEAVKDEVGDLLTPDERQVFEASPHFSRIKQALAPAAWKEVWELRKISFAKNPGPDELPVKLTHLLTKKKATLAFLKAHHEDLKAAIELAGPNPHNAQETWHRVFRDAERAVLRKSVDAFPELKSLGPKTRDFVMWHQKGKLDLLLLKSVPKSISGLFGDQDGLYASACNQYRSSMNEVAHWAKERGWMDYTGSECIPPHVSLLRAQMDRQDLLVGLLQRRDGYEPELEELRSIPQEYRASSHRLEEILHRLDLFASLSEEERSILAAKARLIELGPMERITIQGQPGSSLFVLSEGQLEVLVRQPDGQDIAVASLQSGAVFGEVSFLTGAKRSSTVRSLGQALVFELHSDHLRPLVQSRPQMLEAFTKLMELRHEEREESRQEYQAQKGRSVLGGMASKIRSYLLGP